MGVNKVHSRTFHLLKTHLPLVTWWIALLCRCNYAPGIRVNLLSTVKQWWHQIGSIKKMAWIKRKHCSTVLLRDRHVLSDGKVKYQMWGRLFIWWFCRNAVYLFELRGNQKRLKIPEVDTVLPSVWRVLLGARPCVIGTWARSPSRVDFQPPPEVGQPVTVQKLA